MDINKANAAYLKLRDIIDAKKKEHKAEIKVLEEKQDKILKWLHKELDATGQESARTVAGTAFKATKDSVRIGNKTEFTDFLMQEIEEKGADALYLLTLSANKNSMKEYMEEHEGELPPGINYEKWIEVQVRKSTK